MLRMNASDNLVAYFSMEIGIDTKMKTYSGGLGVLAGDTLHSLADLSVPTVAVTLISEYGYFTQEFDENRQIEKYPRWPIEEHLKNLNVEIKIPVGPHQLHVKLWQYTLTGITGHTLPIIFLDANHQNNPPELKRLTQRLYPANHEYRLLQEILLGVGGYFALKKLDYKPSVYHLNEGHSAFLTLALYDEAKSQNCTDPVKEVRNKCVFTTHTPVPAGHDKFPRDLVREKLYLAHHLDSLHDVSEKNGSINMTSLALVMCGKVNGVGKKHTQVSRNMFPHYRFDSITNGVHHVFWASESVQNVFNTYLPGWKIDPFSLLSVLNIPRNEIMQAHHHNKIKLINFINNNFNEQFKPDIMTIGYARRMAKYKRADLIFYDLERLNAIAERYPFQLVFAGKAHPEDNVGKSIIHEIMTIKSKLNKNISLIYIPEYSIELTKIIIPGVDIWLNTPMRPLEASGTSGMKASLNGVPNVSILDGWWIEGAIEGVTGWSIGPKPKIGEEQEIQCVDCDDSEDLYRKLEEPILPMFYNAPRQFAKVQRNAIALHGSFFNTNRMAQQYIIKSYLT